VSNVLRYLGGLGIEVQGVALDFGCGVGRLTQALAPHFVRVYGVDIAPSMIEQAEILNRHGENCRYLLNQSSDLSLFPDAMFDFIYSQIVLQHMAPRYALKYVAEFLRVLRPGGVAVFQLPVAPANSSWRTRIRTNLPRPLQRGWFRIRHGDGPIFTRLLPSRTPVMELYWVRQRRVSRTVERAGGSVVDVTENDPGNPEVRSLLYCATRNQPH
jgi:SAM-dependent methyltransferase